MTSILLLLLVLCPSKKDALVIGLGPSIIHSEGAAEMAEILNKAPRAVRVYLDEFLDEASHASSAEGEKEE